MKKFLFPEFCFGFLLVLAACAEVSQQAGISGVVTYLQRVALPPSAQVSVKLVDISLADAPVTLMGEQSFNTSLQVPIPFEITYDPASIEDNRTYALEAEIRDAEGNLLFRNTNAFLVLTKGNPIDDVEILLDQINQ